MELNLYIKEGENLRFLKVPLSVVRNLLQDRLGKSELDRINRFADKTKKPEFFKAGSIIIDFTTKTAQCFQLGFNIQDIEPTWDVKNEEMTIFNY